MSLKNEHYFATPRNDTDADIYQWLVDLFPIPRSLTGEGNRDTLRYFSNLMPRLKVHEISSGTKVFDWEIPKEWNIQEAYIEDEDKKRVVDIADNNLHVLGYSYPLDEYLNLQGLQNLLYSREDYPEIIPYVTSYYNEKSGFSLSHNQRESLEDGTYHAVIKSTVEPGSMTYADMLIPGETDEEILITSYICHPQMANNELSGPVVLCALARWLESLPKRKYSYRLVLAPETIGSIAYISKHLDHLKEKVKAGFILSCVGDRGAPSFGASRMENTYADRVMEHVLKHHNTSFKKHHFLDSGGSDNRQYCSPLVDLPMVLFSRSFCDFKEYHTSADDLDAVTKEDLGDSVDIMRKVITLLENDETYISTVHCEPQLGKRGLYRTTNDWDRPDRFVNQQKFLAYSDGQMSLLDIGEFKNVSALNFIDLVAPLLEHDLIRRCK